jgi:fluoride exporter
VNESAAPRQKHVIAAAMRGALLLYAVVAGGAVVGSVLRWAVSAAWEMSGAFPWATLFSNATGSFAIGFIARISAPDGRLFLGARTRQFLMTGVCGGYTTFSAFSLETFTLARHGALATSVVYIVISLFAWLACVWLGDVLAARMNRLKGAR